MESNNPTRPENKKNPSWRKPVPQYIPSPLPSQDISLDSFKYTSARGNPTTTEYPPPLPPKPPSNSSAVPSNQINWQDTVSTSTYYDAHQPAEPSAFPTVYHHPQPNYRFGTNLPGKRHLKQTASTPSLIQQAASDLLAPPNSYHIIQVPPSPPSPPPRRDIKRKQVPQIVSPTPTATQTQTQTPTPPPSSFTYRTRPPSPAPSQFLQGNNSNNNSQHERGQDTQNTRPISPPPPTHLSPGHTGSGTYSSLAHPSASPSPSPSPPPPPQTPSLHYKKKRTLDADPRLTPAVQHTDSDNYESISNGHGIAPGPGSANSNGKDKDDLRFEKEYLSSWINLPAQAMHTIYPDILPSRDPSSNRERNFKSSESTGSAAVHSQSRAQPQHQQHQAARQTPNSSGYGPGPGTQAVPRDFADGSEEDEDEDGDSEENDIDHVIVDDERESRDEGNGSILSDELFQVVDRRRFKEDRGSDYGVAVGGSDRARRRVLEDEDDDGEVQYELELERPISTQPLPVKQKEKEKESLKLARKQSGAGVQVAHEVLSGYDDGIAHAHVNNKQEQDDDGGLLDVSVEAEHHLEDTFRHKKGPRVISNLKEAQQQLQACAGAGAQSTGPNELDDSRKGAKQGREYGSRLGGAKDDEDNDDSGDHFVPSSSVSASVSAVVKSKATSASAIGSGSDRKSPESGSSNKAPEYQVAKPHRPLRHRTDTGDSSISIHTGVVLKQANVNDKSVDSEAEREEDPIGSDFEKDGSRPRRLGKRRHGLQFFGTSQEQKRLKEAGEERNLTDRKDDDDDYTGAKTGAEAGGNSHLSDPENKLVKNAKDDSADIGIVVMKAPEDTSSNLGGENSNTKGNMKMQMTEFRDGGATGMTRKKDGQTMQSAIGIIVPAPGRTAVPSSVIPEAQFGKLPSENEPKAVNPVASGSSSAHPTPFSRASRQAKLDVRIIGSSKDSSLGPVPKDDVRVLNASKLEEKGLFPAVHLTRAVKESGQQVSEQKSLAFPPVSATEERSQRSDRTREANGQSACQGPNIGTASGLTHGTKDSAGHSSPGLHVWKKSSGYQNVGMTDSRAPGQSLGVAFQSSSHSNTLVVSSPKQKASQLPTAASWGVTAVRPDVNQVSSFPEMVVAPDAASLYVLAPEAGPEQDEDLGAQKPLLVSDTRNGPLVVINNDPQSRSSSSSTSPRAVPPSNRLESPTLLSPTSSRQQHDAASRHHQVDHIGPVSVPPTASRLQPHSENGFQESRLDYHSAVHGAAASDYHSNSDKHADTAPSPHRRENELQQMTLRRRNTTRWHSGPQEADRERQAYRNPHRSQTDATHVASERFQPSPLPSVDHSTSSHSHSQNLITTRSPNGPRLDHQNKYSSSTPRRAPSHRVTASAPASSHLLSYRTPSPSTSSPNHTANYSAYDHDDARMRDMLKSLGPNRHPAAAAVDFHDHDEGADIHGNKRQPFDRSANTREYYYSRGRENFRMEDDDYFTRHRSARGGSAPPPSRSFRFWKQVGYLARIVVERFKHWATLSSAGV